MTNEKNDGTTIRIGLWLKMCDQNQQSQNQISEGMGMEEREGGRGREREKEHRRKAILEPNLRFLILERS